AVKTMHMTANVGTGHYVNLIWDNYIGLATIPYYVVYRDTIRSKYTPLDTVPNDGIYSFTDIKPFNTSSQVYYRMGVYNPSGCSPHTHTVEALNYNSSKSNTGNLTVSGMTALNGELSSLLVYPNPTRGMINFSLDLPSKQNITLKVYNTLGQVMSVTNYGKISGHISKEIDLSGLSKGVYILQVSGENSYTFKKIVLQ
ncbi:MAG TPA: T9SS type A sorting domain-containing protein, partial [Bacteroidia bacterium]|nr:T9SS type A sorting domain-containing protein [Bacteroidia bacterium]